MDTIFIANGISICQGQIHAPHEMMDFRTISNAQYSELDSDSEYHLI